MKIGIFTESYLPQSNGVSTSVDICAQALEDRGHEVYIIAPKHPGYKDKKPNVYRLSSIKVLSNPEIRIALQLPEKALLDVLKIDYDVIHCHAGMGGITAVSLEIARARNIPLIATNHTLWNRYTHYFFNGKLVTPKMTERLIKFIGNLCDYTIAPTEYVKKEMIAYGITKPIGVMPSGINCLKYQNVTKGFIREKINVSKNTKILLSVGRLGKEKSFNFLLEAFKVIHDNNRDTVLVLAGDGPEKANLKRLASRFGLTEYVHFLGIVPHENIPQVYADADLFLFASQTETQGMVILEAFASGVPAVVVEDEVFVNVVKSDKNGYLVKKDPQFFAQKVLHLLKDKKTYTAFVDGALQTAEEFSVTNTAEDLEQLYEKLIKEKNSSRKKRTISDINIQQVKKFIRKTTQQFIDTYRL